MIRFLAMLLVATLPVLAQETNTVAPTDEQLTEKLAQAVLLGRVGLYDEAEAACKEILAQKPDQPTAKQLLREVEELRRQAEARDPGHALRRTLEELIVPEVSFHGAKPHDVIDFLAAETKRLLPDNTPINFVWLIPSDAPLKPVTLDLKKVPFTDVLGYATQQAGLRYRIEARAVVIYKPEATRPIPPASEPLHVKPH